MKAQRLANLELLRITAMLFIIIGHALFHSHLSPKELSLHNYWAGQYLSVITSTAVNCYVLISGYFLITSKAKWSKVIKIWISTLFYSIIIFTLINVFVCHANLEIKEIIKSLLPLKFIRQNNCYWFISQYIGMYILSPYINIVIRSLNKNQHRVLILISLCMFCFYGDVFQVDNGFTFIWFIFLYIIGAYIRIYGLPPAFFDINGWTYLFFCLLPVIFYSFLDINGYIIMGQYNNIYVLFLSIFLFSAFNKLCIKNQKIITAISLLSPYTLGVYLIHDNQYVRPFIWRYIIEFSQSNLFIVYLLLYCIFIFIVCTVIDSIRLKIFDILKINTLINKTDNFGKHA